MCADFMAIRLETPVRALPGIGPTFGADFARLGIETVADLLWHIPYRYEDFSEHKAIPLLRHDENVTIIGKIRTIATRPAGKNRRLTLTEAIIENETGVMKATWFNRPYLEKTWKAGMMVSLAGRIDTHYGTTIVNPTAEPVGTDLHTGRIVPIYGLAGALTEKRVRSAIAKCLSSAELFEEWLPSTLLEAEKFPTFAQAIRDVHAPDSQDVLAKAVRRLKFDELFIHQLLFQAVRHERQERPAHTFSTDESFLKTFVTSLPFVLTEAQRKAAWEIIKDLAKGIPMNRLLQGDVGSGKTAVAAMAIANVQEAQGFSAYLAPTELLAEQQHTSLTKFLGKGTGLLTGSLARIGTKDVTRAVLKKALVAGEISVLTGTHALLQEGVPLPELGLVVIDEQHRFGVEQRHALLELGEKAPHLLSMTATPIPRSLALVVYGDLDISILNELPKGRKPILTKLVFEKDRALMWKHVRSLVDLGQQAYVVCPLIEMSEKMDGSNAIDVGESLAKGPFKGVKVGILHGRLKSDEKTQLLRDFRDKKIHVLVATTVVEVGVDVPNATAMVILGAERFGLAQLHQLRGRVGRGDDASVCYLAPDGWSNNAKERLMALVRSNDGFALAEKDLALRGSGNMFGSAQSGFPDFKLATPSDVDLMKISRDWAAEIHGSDPELTHHPLLKKKMDEAFEKVHME